MGVILGSAVVPIALCITWSKANKWGCIGGAVVGFCAGIIAWLVTTSTLNGGTINVTTSGGMWAAAVPVALLRFWALGARTFADCFMGSYR